MKPDVCALRHFVWSGKRQVHWFSVSPTQCAADCTTLYFYNTSSSAQLMTLFLFFLKYAPSSFPTPHLFLFFFSLFLYKFGQYTCCSIFRRNLMNGEKLEKPSKVQRVFALLLFVFITMSQNSRQYPLRKTIMVSGFSPQDDLITPQQQKC